MLVKSNEPVTVKETNLPLPLIGRGKVRDIYAMGEDKLLIITSDRLSAFDVVLPNPIPYKGKVLTQISKFWFELFAGLIPHHLITTQLSKMGLSKEILDQHSEELEGRTMLVKRAKALPVECVVRGYVTGSGWKDYQKTGAVCGHKLPAGLKQCQKLPAPIFTPATKETSGHDINIDFAKAAKRVGEKIAKKLEKISIELYQRGADYAAAKGILIADTKFEFGLIGNELILIDEALTPDSSRFWPAAQYEAGDDQPSFDKQIVRNYLLEIKWNQQPPAPVLPAEVVAKTSEAYCDVYKRLVGKAIQ